MGELAAWHMAEVVARIPFAPAPPDPNQVNPYREQVAPTPGQVRLEKWKRRRRFRAWVDGLRPKLKG
jgi:hypothetical protein